jgi:hypothetical protein
MPLMATIHKEILIRAPLAAIWDAARDLGALHTRLVPGFVVATEMDGRAARWVTFASGLKIREPIISVDDQRHRLAWTAEGGHARHYNAVLELTAEGEHTRVRWTSDLLPDEVEPAIAGMQDQGLAAMKRAFESR